MAYQISTEYQNKDQNRYFTGCLYPLTYHYNSLENKDNIINNQIRSIQIYGM